MKPILIGTGIFHVAYVDFVPEQPIRVNLKSKVLKEGSWLLTPAGTHPWDGHTFPYFTHSNHGELLPDGPTLVLEALTC